jgi:hypothetical protein
MGFTNLPNTLSQVRLNTYNAYGTTNTKIPRFSNVVENYGNSIVYVDSVANGASFTVQEAGTYSISFCWDSNNTTGNGGPGISLNSNQLTTGIDAITVANRLAYSIYNGVNGTNMLPSCASWTGRLNIGDVIRPHTTGSAPNASDHPVLTITQVSR